MTPISAFDMTSTLAARANAEDPAVLRQRGPGKTRGQRQGQAAELPAELVDAEDDEPEPDVADPDEVEPDEAEPAELDAFDDDAGLLLDEEPRLSLR
jgi:hypothetical protein